MDAISKAHDKYVRFKSRSLAGDCLHEAEKILDAMDGLTHEEAKLLLVSFSLGHILGHANKQALSIRLSSQGRGNKAPKALATFFGADRQLDLLRLGLYRNHLADLL